MPSRDSHRDLIEQGKLATEQVANDFAQWRERDWIHLNAEMMLNMAKIVGERLALVMEVTHPPGQADRFRVRLRENADIVGAYNSANPIIWEDLPDGGQQTESRGVYYRWSPMEDGRRSFQFDPCHLRWDDLPLQAAREAAANLSRLFASCVKGSVEQQDHDQTVQSPPPAADPADVGTATPSEHTDSPIPNATEQAIIDFVHSEGFVGLASLDRTEKSRWLTGEKIAESTVPGKSDSYVKGVLSTLGKVGRLDNGRNNSRGSGYFLTEAGAKLVTRKKSSSS